MVSLQAKIDRAKKVVFFGGAGVSTGSGLADFRSAEGLYAREYAGLTAEMILSASFFYFHPDRFYSFYRTYLFHPEAEPNAAHRKLAELEKKGKLTGLVTQNIDGLHRKAGSRLLYELHGNIDEYRCVECGRFYSREWFEKTQGVPKCEECGCTVRPCITLYGEAPDPYSMTGACREIAGCDTLIVAGTSLLVEPAASCLQYFRGREFIVINREPVPAEEKATLVLHGNVEEILGDIHV